MHLVRHIELKVHLDGVKLTWSEIVSWRKHGGTKEAESRLKTPDNPDTKVGKNLAWKFKISSLMLRLENGEETRLKTEVVKDEDGARKEVMRR